MKLYTKDVNGHEVGVGTNVVMTEPKNGRKLVNGTVTRITQNGVFVRFYDVDENRQRVTRRRVESISAFPVSL